MWVEQYKYPFTDVLQNNVISLSYQNVKFVQIGIECPHSIPIYPYDYGNPYTLDVRVTINGNPQPICKINSPDILEFNNLDNQNLTIEIENPEDPYTIITIAYEKED